MSVNKLNRFLVVLITLGSFYRADAKVCILKESCILPCSFKQGDEILIHWIPSPGRISIHSYYYKKDQLESQDQRFIGRTSLFHDQISKGNASLRLTGVKLEDRGKYKCYTSTTSGNKESFIDLDLEAPPREVKIQQVGNRIICSSEGLYPQPKLTWSSTPPTNLTEETMDQQFSVLYSINSSLTVQDSVVDLDYSCTISTGTNKRTATLFQPASINISESKITIPCTSSNIPLKSLIWTFNHTQNILIQATAEVPFKVSEEWRKHVKDVSDSGSLVLQKLTSLQEGTYTCELSTAEKTFVKSTVLKIKETQSTSKVAGITGGVIAVVVISIGITICILYTYTRGRRANTTTTDASATDAHTSSIDALQMETFLDSGTTTVNHDVEQDNRNGREYL